MSTTDSQIDLDTILKRLHLANARRVWRDLVQRAEKEEWSHGQLLQTLFEEEVAHRRDTRLKRAVRAAAFPFLRTVDEFDFTYQSTLRLTTIGSLLAPDFVTEGRAAILLGKPGRGKTHLAIAIAYRALQNGFEALFTTAAELIDTLSAASREGRMREALDTYLKPHVLVVDEVGYLTYGDDAANVLYHVVNERNTRRRAMLFTTNKHPKRWGDVLHDDDLAEAIVDRILERGRLLRLDGPSVRTKHLPLDEFAGDDHVVPGSSRISGTDAAEFPERTSVDWEIEAGTPRKIPFKRSSEREHAVYASPGSMLSLCTPGDSKKLFADTHLKPLWDFATDRIIQAGAIVFLGYRFPPTDALARISIVNAIAQNPDVRVHAVLGSDAAAAARLENLLRQKTRVRFQNVGLLAEEFLGNFQRDAL